MKSTTLAFFLSLFAVSAQAAEAVPAEPGQIAFGLAVLLSLLVLGCLFFYGLFRKRVCSTTPQRRRLIWAAIWTVAPILYLLPFGGAELYLAPIFPLFLIGDVLDLLLGAAAPVVAYTLAVAGWALLGLLYAAVRQYILNRRAKKAAELLSPSEPQPTPKPDAPQ